MESTVNFEKEKVSSEMGNSHLLYLFKKKRDGGKGKHSEGGGISEPWKAGLLHLAVTQEQERECIKESHT